MPDNNKTKMGRVTKKKKQRTGTPPPMDKLLKPAAGIAIAMLGYYFMKGMANEIPRVDVTDQLALREVFFGEGAAGKDYAVLCHPEAADGGVGLPVSSVFQDSADDGSAPAEHVLMDCDHILPDSGKSVYEKFKLNKKKRPTVFVSGRVGSPKQVPEKHLKTGGMLTRLLKQMLEPHAAKIEKTKELKEKCLNRDVCGLLLKGGKPEPYVKHAVANLLGKYPSVQFASVDSTVLFLTNLEAYLPEYEAGVHRFVVFKKISGGLSAGDNETKSEGRLITSILPLETEGVSFSAMNALVSEALDPDGAKAKKIPALPAVKTRTKKLEESERLKRDRKKDQARQREKEAKEPPKQAFTANDGSKEGRRLERDRRRAEHNAENNVKPKTPEEIAEMERMRRKRMEEESAKWNIGAEDEAPEGGEPAEEEWMDSGDDDGGDYAEQDDEDEDDDDVMDLD